MTATVVIIAMLYILGGFLVDLSFRAEREEPSLAVLIFWPLLFVAVVICGIIFFIKELIKDLKDGGDKHDM